MQWSMLKLWLVKLNDNNKCGCVEHLYHLNGSWFIIGFWHPVKHSEMLYNDNKTKTWRHNRLQVQCMKNSERKHKIHAVYLMLTKNAKIDLSAWSPHWPGNHRQKPLCDSVSPLKSPFHMLVSPPSQPTSTKANGRAMLTVPPLISIPPACPFHHYNPSPQRTMPGPH